MRLGCGCLFGVILVVAAIAGFGWFVYQALQSPDLRPVTVTAADSQRVQEKLYAIASRGAPRGSSVTLTEAELNAFLSRNLADLAVTELRVDLARGEAARVTGRTTLGALLTEASGSALRDTLPAGWIARPVWLDLEAVPRVETVDGRRRFVRLDVRSFRIGRQALPAMFVRLLVDPATARVLRFSVPEHVESIRIEPGRAVVRIAS